MKKVLVVVAAFAVLAVASVSYAHMWGGQGGGYGGGRMGAPGYGGHMGQGPGQEQEQCEIMGGGYGGHMGQGGMMGGGYGGHMGQGRGQEQCEMMGGGQMMAPGYGSHMGRGGGMMGGGYGGHMGRGGYGMMGGGASDEETQKFLESTVQERRALHDLKFELREAYRAGDEDKVEALQKQFVELRDQLHEKGAPLGRKGNYTRSCEDHADTDEDEQEDKE